MKTQEIKYLKSGILTSFQLDAQRKYGDKATFMPPLSSVRAQQQKKSVDKKRHGR